MFKKLNRWWNGIDENGETKLVLVSTWYKIIDTTVILTINMTIDPPDDSGWARSPGMQHRAFIKNPRYTR